MNLLGAEALLKLAANLFLKPGRDGHFRLADAETERRGLGLLGLHVSDDAVRLHLADDKIAPAQRLFRIDHRGVSDWSLRHSSQKSRLGQRQLFGVLAEVVLRCRLEAIHSAAEVDLVAIEREDLLLGKCALDLDGEIGFLRLAGSRAVRGKKEIAGKLHGERGRSLGASLGAKVVPQCSGDAKYVDAPMGVEVLVFDRNDSLAKNGSEIVVVDNDSPLQRE